MSTKDTTEHIHRLLRDRYMGAEWAYMVEVPDGTSMNKQRTADAVAIGCWKKNWGLMYAVQREFVRRGATAVAITGDTPDSVRYFKDQDFKNNRAQFIVGCEMFIEGYDHPGIQVVGMASPTLSWTRYAQEAGRGSRTMGEPIGATAAERREWIAGSEKGSCTILDFVGNSTRHDLVLGIGVLGGSFSREEKEESVRLVADAGKAFDISEIARQAKANVAARPKLSAGEGYVFRDLAAEKKFAFEHYADPFVVLGLDPSKPHKVIAEEETYGRPWQAAREYLVESKLAECEIQELCQYSIVYLRDELVRRSQQGLCSYPVARRLYNLGYDCGDMTAATGRRLMNESKAAGGVRPECDGANLRFLKR